MNVRRIAYQNVSICVSAIKSVQCVYNCVLPDSTCETEHNMIHAYKFQLLLLVMISRLLTLQAPDFLDFSFRFCLHKSLSTGNESIPRNWTI
jgi:hypothetical protein